MTTPVLETDPLSVAVALPLSKAYADMGLAGYNKLAEAFHRSQESGVSLTHDETTSAVAAAMVLSFAAELSIKILAFQVKGEYPRGHNLAALVAALPQKTRDGLKAKYEQFVSEGRSILSLNYEMLDKTAPAKSPEPRRGDTFEEAIALASPLFVKLRYLYEEITPGFSAQIDFRWLLFLLEALHWEIQTAEGNATVTWKQNSPTS